MRLRPGPLALLAAIGFAAPCAAHASPVTIAPVAQSGLWQLGAHEWVQSGENWKVGRASIGGGARCVLRWRKEDQFVYLSRSADGGISWLETRGSDRRAMPITFPATFHVDDETFDTELGYFYRPPSEGAVETPFGRSSGREGMGGIRLELPANFLAAFASGSSARLETRFGPGTAFALTGTGAAVAAFRACEAA